jgi:S-adenosylmethionine-diacylgycerolhomoserine-N-methlytransferase
MGGDFGSLRQLLRGLPRGGDHQQQLEVFHAPQAHAHDRFRERLLHSRPELIDHLTVPHGGTLVELGGGTGRNLEYFGSRLSDCSAVYLVDLCRPLINQARPRSVASGCAGNMSTATRPMQPPIHRLQSSIASRSPMR